MNKTTKGFHCTWVRLHAHNTVHSSTLGKAPLSGEKKIQTPKSNLKKSTTKNHTHAKTKLFEQKTQTNKQKTWKVGEQQLQPKKL